MPASSSSTSSPIRWPQPSLTRLKWSMSIRASQALHPAGRGGAAGRSAAAAGAGSRRCAGRLVEGLAVEQAGQGVALAVVEQALDVVVDAEHAGDRRCCSTAEGHLVHDLDQPNALRTHRQAEHVDQGPGAIIRGHAQHRAPTSERPLVGGPASRGRKRLGRRPRRVTRQPRCTTSLAGLAEQPGCRRVADTAVHAQRQRLEPVRQHRDHRARKQVAIPERGQADDGSDKVGHGMDGGSRCDIGGQAPGLRRNDRRTWRPTPEHRIDSDMF